MVNLMKQYLITPAAGKRLIAKALVKDNHVNKALKSGTIVIIAGTTNGYVAEEILSKIDQNNEFSTKRFFRGIILPPSKPRREDGRLSDNKGFPGDVIITQGKWQKGKTIFDVVDDLGEGDVIFKGANLLDLSRNQVGIYIGHPKGGTIGVALQAHIGRRVKLILPVGLEKRVDIDINKIANKLNQPGISGPRILPVTGDVFTEIDAIKMLSGADAELVAAGGVAGAEGSVWLLISGNDEEIKSAEDLINSVSNEPLFSL
jgi:hypothetical protein